MSELLPCKHKELAPQLPLFIWHEESVVVKVRVEVEVEVVVVVVDGVVVNVLVTVVEVTVVDVTVVVVTAMHRRPMVPVPDEGTVPSAQELKQTDWYRNCELVQIAHSDVN